ncbi:MAG: NlpC/P60 family protein [Roseobacter sp.]
MNEPNIPNSDTDTSQETGRIVWPVVDLTRGPQGPRDRQLLFGDRITILERQKDNCLIRSEKDGYRGTVPSDACGPAVGRTHRVSARTTHAYAQSNFKSPNLFSLPFGAHLSAVSETETFIETEIGFVPRQHLRAQDTFSKDPVSIAEIFLGTPYLWGGNTYQGIDCSGLVQTSFMACGIACAADSSQQVDSLGVPLAEDEERHRNDLIFWKGHVALVVDENTLIHANAGYMETVYEPIADALTRIEAQGDGPPISYRRVQL